jgi:hypothetical protein
VTGSSALSPPSTMANSSASVTGPLGTRSLPARRSQAAASSRAGVLEHDQPPGLVAVVGEDVEQVPRIAAQQRLRVEDVMRGAPVAPGAGKRAQRPRLARAGRPAPDDEPTTAGLAERHQHVQRAGDVRGVVRSCAGPVRGHHVAVAGSAAAARRGGPEGQRDGGGRRRRTMQPGAQLRNRGGHLVRTVARHLDIDVSEGAVEQARKAAVEPDERLERPAVRAGADELPGDDRRRRRVDRPLEPVVPEVDEAVRRHGREEAHACDIAAVVGGRDGQGEVVLGRGHRRPGGIEPPRCRHRAGGRCRWRGGSVTRARAGRPAA